MNGQALIVNQAPKMIFDWDAFVKFLIETPGEREKIGSAWCLFFDLAQNVDRAGIYTNTYARLAKKYGVALITVKTWRQYLRRHTVIESYSQGHSVAFRLLEPYLSFVKSASANGGAISDTEEAKDLLAIKRLILRAAKDQMLQAAA